jgi:acetyl-CoA carboxylase biotin carboxylase subunit
MEMNTRLQVEHPLTELITHQDLVAWQIKIAAGQPLTLKQDDIHLDGHAIECRINAEDPLLNFRPSPGLIREFQAPEQWRDAQEGPIRLDTHVESGYRIPTLYDSMLAKLIVHAPTREEAIQTLDLALSQLKIEGVPTTIALHRFLIKTEAFQSGDYHTPQMSEEMKRFAQESTQERSQDQSQDSAN